MTQSQTQPQKDFSKPIIKIVAVAGATIIIVALILYVLIPMVTRTNLPGQSSSLENFDFLSKSGWSTKEGGFFGIGGDYVVYVSATIKNIGATPAGCIVNAKVTEGGSYWTKTQSIYLSVGEEKTVSFRFPEPINGPCYWSIWLSQT